MGTFVVAYHRQTNPEMAVMPVISRLAIRNDKAVILAARPGRARAGGLPAHHEVSPHCVPFNVARIAGERADKCDSARADAPHSYSEASPANVNVDEYAELSK